MKLGRLARAAILLIAPVLSAMAAAQGGEQPARTGALNLPGNVQFVGKQDPGVRKATAIVNGDVITGSDVDHRMALILASNQIQLPPEEVERFRAQVLRNLIDETLQIQAAAQQEITIEDREVNQYYERFAANFRADAAGVQRLSALDRLVGALDEAPDPRRARLAAAAAPQRSSRSSTSATTRCRR